MIPDLLTVYFKITNKFIKLKPRTKSFYSQYFTHSVYPLRILRIFYFLLKYSHSWKDISSVILSPIIKTSTDYHTYYVRLLTTGSFYESVSDIFFRVEGKGHYG